MWHCRVPELVSKVKGLKVNVGTAAGTDVGPMISPAAKARAESIIAAGIKAGATVELDGRGVVVKGYEAGNFLGPTVLCNVNPGNPAYDEEIFGPVCVCVCVCVYVYMCACACACACMCTRGFV